VNATIGLFFLLRSVFEDSLRDFDLMTPEALQRKYDLREI